MAAIVERLQAIEKVLAQYSAAICSKEESDKANPQSIHAEVTFDDVSKREIQAGADRQNAIQDSIRWAAWLAFAAAFLYAGLAAITLNEMHTQTQQIFHQADVENAGASWQAMRDSTQLRLAQAQAKSAQESAAAIQRQMREDQRAWINPDIVATQIVVNMPIGFNVAFLNIGKTPAEHFQARMRTEILTPSESPTFDYSNPMTANSSEGGLILPGFRQAPIPVPAMTQVPGSQIPEEITLTPEMDKKYIADKLWFSFEGEVFFTDIFHVKHWMHFCHAGINIAPTKSLIKAPEGAKRCAEYNQVDDRDNKPNYDTTLYLGRLPTVEAR